MSVSLKNKKNTKIIDNQLGATTCDFDKVNRIVTILRLGYVNDTRPARHATKTYEIAL